MDNNSNNERENYFNEMGKHFDEEALNKVVGC